MHSFRKQLKHLVGLISFACLLSACSSSSGSLSSPEFTSTSADTLGGASFTATQIFDQEPLRVDFELSDPEFFDDEEVFEDGVTYTWHFGDSPVPGRGKRTMNVYKQPGTYNAILTVRYKYGSVAQAARSVLVLEAPANPLKNAPPTAFIAGPPKFGITCQDSRFDASMSFDTDGDIVDYQWDFGDGSEIVHTKTNYIYRRDSDSLEPEIGDFIKVKLTVRDNQGATAQAEIQRYFSGESWACKNPSDPGNP